MSSFGITDQGFNRKRLDVIVNELEAELKLIFGEDLNVAAESPDGQMIGVFSKALADLYEIAELAYLSTSPLTATGIALTRLAAIGGIERKQATASTITLTITGDVGTVIPVGSQAKQPDAELIFSTDAEVTLGPSGTTTVAATGDLTGPIPALSNTVTNIESPVAGWTGVTNVDAATLGTNVETDAELRTRFITSRSVAGAGTVDAIYAAVSAVDGVTFLTVTENRNSTTNTSLDLPGNNIRVVVIGGDDQEIAQAIWDNKPAGIQLDGNHPGPLSIVDSQGNTQFITFSRPVAVPIQVTGALATVGDESGDGTVSGVTTLIAEAIVEWASTEMGVGENVIGTKLFVPVHGVALQYDVFDLRISRVDDPANYLSVIDISSEEIATFDVANINFLLSS